MTLAATTCKDSVLTPSDVDRADATAPSLSVEFKAAAASSADPVRVKEIVADVEVEELVTLTLVSRTVPNELVNA